MFLIIPKKITVSSEFSQKQYLSAFQKNTYFMKETGVFKVSKLIKNNWDTQCYYGTRKDNKLTLFYHRPKKRDGGGIRFNGTVEKTKDGCQINGYIKQSWITYVLAVVWMAVFVLLSLLFLVDAPKNLFISLSLIIIGFFVFFWCGKRPKYIKAFLEVLGEKEPKPIDKREEEKGED